MTPLPAASCQLLLCLAADRDAPPGRLQRFERMPGRRWVAAGTSVPVTLGRAGLAWGRGLHPAMPGLQKREGDGRSPAGIFAITALFGAAAPDSAFARAAKLPYLCATRELKCIDDPASAHYNRIVDQFAVAQPDWRSCEDMLRGDERYAVGAVVGHNCDPVVPGAGSCMFLHVWAAPGVPTAGCAAMALADMSEIAGWLDGAASPLLVQLPQMEYERLRDAWGLPVFAAQD
jgi:L,D-peptidoglycan transpeptidase YkuD (ErfK/YbiS/YcfS/YnhG family)